MGIAQCRIGKLILLRHFARNRLLLVGKRIFLTLVQSILRFGVKSIDLKLSPILFHIDDPYTATGLQNL